MISGTVTRINAPEKCGEHPDLISDGGARWRNLTPLFQNGYVAGTYTVPSGYKLALQSLVFSVQNADIASMADRGAIPLGDFFLRVDGSTVMEGRFFFMPDNLNAGYLGNNDHQASKRFIDLGDGIAFTVGQVVTIAYTPIVLAGAAQIGCKLIATLAGVAGSTPDIQYARTYLTDATALQTAITYTVPVGGWTLQGFGLAGYGHDFVCSYGTLYIGGQPVWEGPFQDRHDGTSRPTPISLDFGDGVVLYEGQSTELRLVSYYDMNQIANFVVSGELTLLNPSEGGGGGGSFSFVG